MHSSREACAKTKIERGLQKYHEKIAEKSGKIIYKEFRSAVSFREKLTDLSSNSADDFHNSRLIIAIQSRGQKPS